MKYIYLQILIILSINGLSAQNGSKIDLLADSLSHWKITNFGGEGSIYLENDELIINYGEGLSGLTWNDSLPTNDYTIELEAMRVHGTDFFCGLTFPVGKDHCSLIVGGWGGALVGISSLNGKDASENHLTSFHSFSNGDWYAIKIQVDKDEVRAWIGEQQVLVFDPQRYEISVRGEMLLSRPLGIATWYTKAKIRNFRLCY